MSTGATGIVEGAEHGSLRMEGVTKRYRSAEDSDATVTALHDVSLEVVGGETVGLIGPNGAGKSTVLKVAAGVTTPSAGRVVRTGRTSTVIELGAGVHPDLSGRENLELLYALTTGARRLPRARFAEIVAFSELGDVLDRATRHYSTGMLARLGFAVATHSDPEVLLVDEVLSVGDLSFQRRCVDRMYDLRRAGTALVVASHDLELVTAMCDRAILLTDGEVELVGDAAEVVNHYAGLPPTAAAAGGMALRLAAPRVEAGEGLRVEVDVPDPAPGASLRFDYVVPTTPTVRETGRGDAIVCGTAFVRCPDAGPAVVELTTSGLPPGPYELHVTLETDARAVAANGRLPFVLSGRPGPFAIRLSSRTRVDGLLVEET